MNHRVELKLGEHTSTSGLVDHFREVSQSSDEVIVVVPLPSIGNANSPVDIVADLLEASFVAETLGQCAQLRSFEWQSEAHIQQLHLKLSGYQAETLSHELARMALLLDFPEVEVERLRDEYQQVLENLVDHEEELSTRDLIFPEIADLYFMNLVRGAYYEWEPGVVAEDIRRWPERRYGFIRSRLLMGSALCSGDEWIIPDSVGLQRFREQVEDEPEALLPGAMVVLGDAAVFIGTHGAVTVPADTVFNALACGDDFMRRSETDLDVHDLLRFRGVMREQSALQPEPHAPVLIGEFASRAVMHCDGYCVAFMDVTEVHARERLVHANRLAALEVSLRDGEPPATHIHVPWPQIDDEAFEQLCFDYLFAHPEFDRNRLEKIGKSRSRDGGRDIVAWTVRDRFRFTESRKYIFQCKHIPPNVSLTPAKHFQAIGDTIEQYSAHGYGVMCSGYIDATLHDRIDAIATSRRLEDSFKVDRLHLERFLARRPHLVARYFKP